MLLKIDKMIPIKENEAIAGKKAEITSYQYYKLADQ